MNPSHVRRWLFFFAVMLSVTALTVTIVRGYVFLIGDENELQPAEISDVPLSVQSPCMPRGPGGFLKVERDHVAVFLGEDEDCTELQERTDIVVSELHADVQKALQVGIPFRDPLDLPQILDGLVSGVD